MNFKKKIKYLSLLKPIVCCIGSFNGWYNSGGGSFLVSFKIFSGCNASLVNPSVFSVFFALPSNPQKLY